MKLNWGTGIALVYGIFALSMLGFAIQSTKHDVNLIKKEYYEDDINYQVHYDKIQNAMKLKTDLKVALDSTGSAIVLSFPAALPKPTGKVLIFRPSQTGVDVELTVEVNAQNAMEIPTSSLKAGLWKIKVEWQAEGKDFYKEQSLIIAH